MELECKCYRVWHAEDDSETKMEKCLIHGPEGTDAKKIAHLKSEHFRVKAARQAILDDLRKHINASLYTPAGTNDIPGAIIAALLWVRKESNGNLPYPPEDTYERTRLMHTYEVDPEDDRVKEKT